VVSPEAPSAPLAAALSSPNLVLPAALPTAPVNSPVPETGAAQDAALAGLSLPLDGLQQQLQNGGGADISAAAGADFSARLGRPEAALPSAGSAEIPGGSGFGPSWSRGSFEGADGAKISYFARPGSGPAVLLVHGRTLGAESFLGWADDAFAGRPMMILERRGYGRSEIGRVDEKNLGAVESEDVRRAIETASALGQGKVGVLAYSLGALILPELEPSKVAWLALVNPGAAGMLAHMPSETQAGAQWLRGAYAASAWIPFQRDMLVASVVGHQQGDFHKRLADGAGGGPLGRVLADDLEARMKDPRKRELWVQESLWAAFGPHLPFEPRVPVLFYLNRADETVPKAAYAGLVRAARRSSSRVRVVRAPGGHLAPVFRHEGLRRALETFDAGR
jgi:hypothetical protein